jgi:integrase
MREQPYEGQSLFGKSGSRKYLNAAERRRFLESAQQLPPHERSFCQVLAWSGARISEVLALVPAAFDIESGAAGITTLKRRKRGIVRQVPLPPDLLTNLDRVFGLGAAKRDPERAGERIWSFRHDRVALCEVSDGFGRYYRHARNAERVATRVWRESIPSERATASRATVARSCFAEDNCNLW